MVFSTTDMDTHDTTVVFFDSISKPSRITCSPYVARAPGCATWRSWVDVFAKFVSDVFLLFWWSVYVFFNWPPCGKKYPMNSMWLPARTFKTGEITSCCWFRTLEKLRNPLALIHAASCGSKGDTNICRRFDMSTSEVFQLVSWPLFTWVPSGCVLRTPH